MRLTLSILSIIVVWMFNIPLEWAISITVIAGITLLAWGVEYLK